MTFGEHLEELRVCLFRAVTGLVVGLVLGLVAGSHVVKFIQTPLTDALTKYIQTESLNRVHKELEEDTASGQPSPYTEEQFGNLLVDKGLFVDRVLIDPVPLLEQLKGRYPDSFKNVEFPRRGPASTFGIDDLVHVVMFHRAADDPRTSAKSLSVHEGFMIYLKASLLVGAVVASPWIFYQVWMFVAAGLYPHEKRYINIYLPFSILLFMVGAAVAFFFVFKPVLDFLFTFNRYLGISPEPRISEWMSFVLMLPLAFGITFQLPLVMLFLERVGVFTVKAYLSYWRVAVLVIFVLAAPLGFLSAGSVQHVVSRGPADAAVFRRDPAVPIDAQRPRAIARGRLSDRFSCGGKSRDSPVFFRVDLAGRLARMFAKALRGQKERHLLDHRRVAAEEDVRVGRLGVKRPSLVNRPGVPRVLAVASPSQPGRALFFRPAHDR